MYVVDMYYTYAYVCICICMHAYVDIHVIWYVLAMFPLVFACAIVYAYVRVCMHVYC
jgi:hypothetical protein